MPVEQWIQDGEAAAGCWCEEAQTFLQGLSPSSESQSLRHPAYPSSLNSQPHPLICCKDYHPKTVGRSQNEHVLGKLLLEHVLGKLLLEDLEDQGATDSLAGVRTHLTYA